MGRSRGIAAGLVVIVILFVVVAWHDGVIGTTSIGDINLGRVDIGTVVTVKGTMLFAIDWGGGQYLVTIQDNTGSYALFFTWNGAVPSTGSNVVVRGTVATWGSLTDVTMFETIWILQ
jgi:hypothetical protein